MRESKNLLALIAFGGSGTKGEQKSKPVGLREWDGFVLSLWDKDRVTLRLKN